MTKEKEADLMTNQRLLSNKDLMIKNLEQLIDNLRECELYITEVLGNQIVADSDIARALNACIS